MRQRKLHRCWAGILVFAMAISLMFSGCSTTQQNSSGQAGSSESQDSSQSSGEVSQTSQEKNYDEHMVISFALVGQNEGTDYNGDDLAKTFMEKFNFEFESINLSWDNWAEKSNIWINSNDLPDMLQWDFKYSEYVNYVDQELFYRLPDDWETRWPSLAEADRQGGLKEHLKDRVDCNYFVTRPIYFDKPTEPLLYHSNLYLRQDWADQVGFETKDTYTTEEVMEYARLVKEADPVGGGRTIPIDGAPDSLVSIFMQQQNVYFDNFYKGDDGKYHWGPADESTLDGLKLWKQAYEEGLLNKDFYVSGIMPEDNFYNGISGAMYASCTGHNINLTFDSYEKATGNNALEDIRVSHMVDKDGNYQASEIVNFWTGTVFSPNLSVEKFERIMDIMDFSASEEGQNLTRLGIKDVDYSVDENGEITILRDKKEDGSYTMLSDKYPSLLSLYNNMTILPDDFGLKDPSVAPERMQIVKDMFASKAKLGIDTDTVKSFDWDLYFFSSPAKEKFNLSYPSEYAQLVLMEGDLEENWRNWCDQHSSMVNTILDELNAM